MSKYFNLIEMVHSDTADIKHIDNSPNEEERQHLIELMEILDSLRAFVGVPLKVTSGFRCARLNKAVGGAAASAHVIGYAADLVPMKGSFDGFIQKAKLWAETSGVDFDQLLIEKNSKGKRWLHFGLYNQKGEQRKQIKNLYVQ